MKNAPIEKSGAFFLDQKPLTPALSQREREPIGGCSRFAAVWQNDAASENPHPSSLPEGADWGML